MQKNYNRLRISNNSTKISVNANLTFKIKFNKNFVFLLKLRVFPRYIINNTSKKKYITIIK